MAWNGYFRFGDNEVINLPRALAYARAKNLAFVRQVGDNAHLSTMLGEVYSSPESDLPPWADPDEPQSFDFCGVIPLEVSGLEDSTRQSEVFEFTHDGGNPGRLRHTTKAVVFNVALIGATEAAVEYGFRWLKRALMERDCAPGSTIACRGLDLTYSRVAPFSEFYEPVEGPVVPDIVDGGTPADDGTGVYDGGTPSDPGGTPGGPNLTEDWADFERHLREVLVNRGPQVTSQKTSLTCGGAMWLVTFTATAGDPFEYGPVAPVLTGWGDGTDPYAPDVTGTYGATTYEEAACPVSVYTPIYDPLCPALVAPPAPPDIMAGCFDVVDGTWDRLFAVIPDSMVPLWDEVRPVVTIRTEGAEARMLRVRFYESDGDPGAECGAVGEFLISYIPAFHTLVVDTVANAVYAYSGDGVIRRADSLVYGDGNARPITWFGLSCGDAYTVTLDSPVAGMDAVEVDLDLVPRSA